MADLAPVVGTMRLGVTETFARRTGDRMRPWPERYGLDFAEVQIVDGADRGPLCDALAAGRLDVVIGVSTDADFEALAFAMLTDLHGFFPAYPAAPPVRTEMLARVPAIAEAAEALAGALDAETTRALNAAMVFEGLSVREAAEGALTRLGLLDRSSQADIPPLILAASPADRGAAVANRALRAAIGGRRVEMVFDPDPVGAVALGEARLALAAAPVRRLASRRIAGCSR